ncbi:hypothetical protein [Luteimonas suaedae]|uniref:hypothetical protein n=1 Tax=Luteimonas suaedae TaxID=2605430 RepID=UPI0011ED1F68|nr:hypothetical protein [Luteimonas suaedae]
MSMRFLSPRPRHAAAFVLMGTTMACAHGVPPVSDASVQTAAETAAMSRSEATSTTVEGEGARLEVSFQATAGGPLQVRYRVHNTADADLAVFDRGNRHAVLIGRQHGGAVGDPSFREDGGDVTLSHVALPLAQPSPTVPPVPLAAKLVAGGTLEGAFAFTAPTAEAPKRMRWCLGVAPFDEADFSAPEEIDEVEIWQASFALAERQQTLCTPWFDLSSGMFAPD